MGRMEPLSVLLAGVLTLAAAGCQPEAQQRAGGEAAVDTTAILSSMDSMRSVFQEAVRAGDFQTQADVYTPDAVYSHPGLPPVQGRDSIRSVLERNTPPGASLEIEPMDLRILGPDWLYEFGTATLSFTPEGAEEAVRMGTTYLAVFHRTEAGWKIAREALSANQPPPSHP